MMRFDTDVLTNELGESGVTHFGFAQRKYVGFWCKYEYDVKCLLIATEKSFCMVTYKLNASYEQVKNLTSPNNKHQRASSAKVFKFNKNSQESSKGEEESVAREKANITLRWKAMDHETIKHVSFVDDERP